MKFRKVTAIIRPERLEAVVEIDNILLDSLLIGTPNNANLEARLRELLGVRDQLIPRSDLC